jgi:hypothetical protein
VTMSNEHAHSSTDYAYTSTGYVAPAVKVLGTVAELTQAQVKPECCGDGTS